MNKIMLREKFRQSPGVLHDHEIASLVGVKLDHKQDSIGKILDMTHEELTAAGYTEREADTIKSIKELATRYLSERMEKRDLLTSPERVIQFMRMKIGGLPHEAFMCIFLSTQNEVIGHEVINEGTVDQVAVYPRRIMEKALQRHAAGLIIGHNHPSGFTDPSEEDKNLTRTLRQAAQVLDVRLLDHLIVGKNGYFSFVERGLI